MRIKILFFLIIILPFSSCKSSKKSEAEEIVEEWVGKSIKFPTDIGCTVLGKDTVCPDLVPTEYHIIAYIDSTGCSSCKLKLSTWCELMKEADSIMPGKVSFSFYFHPKNEKDLEYIVRHENFKHPVFLDKEDKLNKLNQLPTEMEYQCFLIDRNNKIISIGNPTLNIHIWELYKKVILNQVQNEEDE